MIDPEELAQTLAEIGGTHMPFGRYGPEKFPPRGTPLYDLPFEYLLWFSRQGFPKSRLGELMEIVFHLKADGCDEVFGPMRAAAGGRSDLRMKRRRPNPPPGR